MTESSAKYSGSKEFLLVYGELIRTAQYQGLTTYQALAEIMGLPMKGSHMGREIGRILGEIVEEEVSQGRPMLSAVVVGVGGSPGPGFYELARQLGRLQSDTKEEEYRFWQSELSAVYATWKREYQT